MLAFGMAYEEFEISSTITMVNGERVTTKNMGSRPVTIEPVDRKNLRYGFVKTDQTQERETGTGFSWNWVNATLYDLVDIETGYVLARTFKPELKEAIKLITEYGFQHTESGQYRAPNGFEINSKKQYKQGLPPVE
jgi:hypothetical protein